MPGQNRGSSALSTSPRPGSLSRRTLATGAAWALPVIATAAAAPSVSASPLVDIVTQSACKYPGNSDANCKKYYHFNVLVWNYTSVPLTVTVDSITEDTSNPLSVAPNSTFTNPITLNPGSTSLSIILSGSNNSSNLPATITIQYHFTYQSLVYNYKEDFYYPGTNPCTNDCPPSLTP